MTTGFHGKKQNKVKEKQQNNWYQVPESEHIDWTIMNVVGPIYAANGILTSLRRNKSRL